jgi:hypothetical protein
MYLAFSENITIAYTLLLFGLIAILAGNESSIDWLCRMTLEQLNKFHWSLQLIDKSDSLNQLLQPI